MKGIKFEEFVKLSIDSTKYDEECLNNFRKFYNYFYSLDNLEEKHVQYYNISGLGGRSVHIPSLIDYVNLKSVYTKLNKERFNYVKWHKIYKKNYNNIELQHDSLTKLDTLYGVYIPKKY